MIDTLQFNRMRWSTRACTNTQLRTNSRHTGRAGQQYRSFTINKKQNTDASSPVSTYPFPNHQPSTRTTYHHQPHSHDSVVVERMPVVAEVMNAVALLVQLE